MTLAEFRRDTADMPGSTELLVLDPWGGLQPSAIVCHEDLVEGDPVREAMPANAIVITQEAN